MDDDLAHHLRRELHERKLAETTSDPIVRAAHLEVADQHSKRAEYERIRAQRTTDN